MQATLVIIDLYWAVVVLIVTILKHQYFQADNRLNHKIFKEKS